MPRGTNKDFLNSRRSAGRIPRELVIFSAVGLFILLAVAVIFVRPTEDRGIRLWLLNHAPDQLVIVNPDTGEKEKELLVADGLVQLIFNNRKDTAFIANVVDVSNKVTLVDTRNYLKVDTILLSGVPQGLAIFPDDRYLAVISASRTDFEAGGFDVIDLETPSEVDPNMRFTVYRERGLRLTSSIHVDENGYIYCLDAKDSRVFIFDSQQKKLVKSIDIGSAPIQLYYPKAGRYFFVTSIKDESITFFSKGKTPDLVNKVGSVTYARFRYLVINSDGSLLYAPVYEKKIVAVIDVNQRKVIDEFSTPEGVQLIGISPFDDEIYPVGFDTGQVFVMNAKNGRIKRTIKTSGEFRDIDVLLESEKPALR